MMLARIDPGAVARLARADLPRPLDVLNLIHLRDERSYARYGVAVTPVLSAVGGRLRWMGHHERTLLGEPQAERLMIVRYPSHRRFLAMTLNPYYVLINRLRERGVDTFEASFTYAESEPLELRSQRRLLIVHFAPPTTLDRVRELLEPQAGPLVYASREVASASFLKGRRPTDPNPLTFPQIACFAAEDGAAPALDGLEHAAVAIYCRTHPRELAARAR
jgi:uncharacterized protein (DUF1330 family)